MRILKSAKALFLNIILVVTVIAVFVLLSAVIRNNLADDYVLVNDRASAEIEYADGRHSVIAEPEGLRFGKVGAGDVITLNVHLPSDPLITDGDLALCVYSTTVEVWYHNTLLGMYGQESAQKGRMVGKQYCFIPIPDSVWGDEFTIILHPTEKDAFTNLPSHLFIVKKEAAHMLMLRGQSASFFITVILMAFGLFGSIACAFGVTGQFTAKKSFYICVAAYSADGRCRKRKISGNQLLLRRQI